MTTINLQATHTRRVEWVQSHIMGLFDLPHRPEKYNTPEKWEETISLLMSTSARDFDAKRLHPDSTKHAAEALNRLKEGNLLDHLATPLGEVSHITFAREMANLIVDAADTIDNNNNTTTTYNPFTVKATIIAIFLSLILLTLFIKYGL